MKILFFKYSLFFISLNANIFASMYFSVNEDAKTISFSGQINVVPYQDPMMAMYYLRSGTDDSGPFTSLDLSAAFTGYPEESNPRWELWTNQSAFSIGDMSKTESYTLTATDTEVSYAHLSDIYQTQIENLVAFGTNTANSYGYPTSFTRNVGLIAMVSADAKTISFSGQINVVPYQDPMMAMYYLRSGTDDSGPFTSLDLSAAFTGYPEESNPRWELWTNQSAFSIGDMSKTESYTLTATDTEVSYAHLSDIYQTQIENLVVFGTNTTNSYGSPTSIPVISYSSYLLDLINRIESERDTALAERDARPTQADYDAVVADRNSRPTQAAYDSVVAERNARLTQSEVRDLRLGSSMLEVVDGDASINIELEATDNLGITSPTWKPVPESKVIIHPNYQSGKIRIDVGADDESNAGVRFFRFKMNDSDSSNKDINLSIGESEYDEAAIIQALADQYGVPASSISLSVTGG